ncbi:LacI family DNA-binding transcriptional regulator [Microbacterium sp. LMI12-1-1.1]|uniref:LacI family DNA-binding transcriptional regulator n=1 Tax=Microbacterium sp. LMI12-1-1.1 TaxID=3135225 RepID=UPI0034293DE2
MFTPQIVRPATSSDVARAAGVSRATVSLVLNNHENARIPEDTRIRVREAARHLGYVPNNAARALKASANTGWVLDTRQVDPDGVFARAIDLVGGEASDNGEDVFRDVDATTLGTDAASSWARIRPAAVLASAGRCTPEATEFLRSAGVRALLVYGSEQVDYAPTVVLPQREYGRCAIDFLQHARHRRILCVMPAAAEHKKDVAERLGGVRDDAADDTTVTVQYAESSSASLRDWAHSWRYAADPPTAVICYDDRHARATIRALHDAGVRCPQDVAVLGAQDMPFAAEHIPSITSVTFSPDVMAERISDALNSMLSGERIERIDSPPLHIVQRESTQQRTS